MSLLYQTVTVVNLDVYTLLATKDYFVFTV